MSAKASQRKKNSNFSLHSWPGWGLQTLRRWEKGEFSPLDRLWLDSRQVMLAAGMEPDPWQIRALNASSPRVHIRCSRQSGKSTDAAAIAVKAAVTEAPCLILVVSPTERQSGELMMKIKQFWGSLTNPGLYKSSKIGTDGASLVKTLDAIKADKEKEAFWDALPKKSRESALQLHLDNGSRILGLPGKPGGIVGFSGVGLLLIDEAARVSDELYKSVRPMLATSRGRLIAMSTPFGKRGWFYEEDISDRPWERIVCTAFDCPRIPTEFLEEEYAALGERWFRQEYLGSYEAAVGQVFAPELIERAMEGGEGIEPMFKFEG